MKRSRPHPQREPLSDSQESVWDYPCPPCLELSSKQIRVTFAGETVAASSRALRVLETSHPPVYYLPPEDVRLELLTPTPQRSMCEFKGGAVYWTLQLGDQISPDVAWSYPQPTAGFAALQDYLAFYPSRVAACFVDGEQVQAQAGDFYGGWITCEIRGPFKGAAGTWGW